MPELLVTTTPIIMRAIFASIGITGGTGNWNVGDEIQGGTTGAKAIITEIENPGATATLHFSYISPFTSFNGSEAIANNTDTGAATGSTAEVTATQDLILRDCKNYSPIPSTYGGARIGIKVLTGSIQFAVDLVPSAINPVYTVDESFNIKLLSHNILKVLPAAGNATFEVVIGGY